MDENRGYFDLIFFNTLCYISIFSILLDDCLQAPCSEQGFGAYTWWPLSVATGLAQASRTTQRIEVQATSKTKKTKKNKKPTNQINQRSSQILLQTSCQIFGFFGVLVLFVFFHFLFFSFFWIFVCVFCFILVFFGFGFFFFFWFLYFLFGFSKILRNGRFLIDF